MNIIVYISNLLLLLVCVCIIFYIYIKNNTKGNYQTEKADRQTDRPRELAPPTQTFFCTRTKHLKWWSGPYDLSRS